MSYDLCFWSQEGSVNQTPEEIYSDLCAGKTVLGLLEIPTDAFLDRISKAFPGSIKENEGSVFWENGKYSFHASCGAQGVGIACSGGAGEWMNVFVDIGLEFDCALYDPQINERFTC